MEASMRKQPTRAVEARILGRHLVGRRPPESAIERYGKAHRLLLERSGDERDGAVAAFALRHPWSLPLLDAACGVVRPQGILRSKLLIMAAVLEASPELAAEFLPRDTPRAALVVKLGCFGLAAVLRTALGLLLYPVASRSRT